MMDTEFRVQLTEGWMIVYIDDMIIYSMTWEEHIDRIKTVLDIVISMGMKVSLKSASLVFLS